MQAGVIAMVEHWSGKSFHVLANNEREMLGGVRLDASFPSAV